MSSAPTRSSRPSAAPERVAHPPETLEGWYSLHQLFSIDRGAPLPSRLEATRRVASTQPTESAGAAIPAPDGGWSAFFRLIGSSSDIMIVHFRPTLDAIGDAQRHLARLPLMSALRPTYSFLSVTEAGLYHLTAQLAREAAARGGSVGDAAYMAELTQRIAVERENPHVQRRLYPQIPDGMPYVCFYPMSKRRQTGQNWYSLTLEERSRLMWEHGITGRRYAGRVLQIIAGSVGFESWEWGVTLFAGDPLDFKKIVTDMRFDEVSAKYAEFGDFYVGKLSSAEEIAEDVRAVIETG